MKSVPTYVRSALVPPRPCSRPRAARGQGAEGPTERRGTRNADDVEGHRPGDVDGGACPTPTSSSPCSRTFNKDYPNVKVDIETLTYDQMRDKLVSSFLASKPTYDLIIVDNPWMVDFATAGFLQPLDSRIEAPRTTTWQDFSAAAADIATSTGNTYGVPFYNYALALHLPQGPVRAGRPDPAQDAAGARRRRRAELKTGDRAGIAMQPQRGYKIFEEWGNWLFAAGGSIYGCRRQGHAEHARGKQGAARPTSTMYKIERPKNSPELGVRRGAPVGLRGQVASMMCPTTGTCPRSTSRTAAGPRGQVRSVARSPAASRCSAPGTGRIPANSGRPTPPGRSCRG